MNISGLNTLNAFAPTTTPSSRGDAAAERAPAPGPKFGDVLAQRGVKPGAKPAVKTAAAGKAASFAKSAPAADDTSVDDVKTEATAAPDAAPGPRAANAPVVARINIVDHLAPRATGEIANAPANAVNAAATDEDAAAVAPAANEDAWAQFLTQLNDELGVSPADVLTAFETLSEDDLAAKPEDTTDQMVAAMGLTGQSAMLAKQYLSQLIERTAAPTEGPAANAPQAESAMTAVAGQSPFARPDSTLDMNSPAARAPSVPGAGAATLDSVSEPKKSLADLTASSNDEVKPKTSPFAEAQMRATTNDQSRAEVAAPSPTAPSPFALPRPAADVGALNKMMDELEPVTAEDQPKVDQLVRNLIGKTPGSAAALGDAAAQMEKQNGANQAPSNSAFAAAAPKADLGAQIFGGARRDDDDTADSDTNSDNFGADLNANRENQFAAGGQAKSEFASELGAKVAAPAGTPPTIAPEIVDTARVMLRNGGGEMNVTLNPDGLGEIAMKVNVQNGKVSVQMMTDSDETKKLLEHTLDDLKIQLIANNLQVDQMKVDTSANLAKQNEQGQQDAQRQAAQQSFEQFNQNQNQGQQNQARRAAYDAPVPRGYGNAIGAGSTNPLMAPASPNLNSRRLNLVA